MITLTIDNPIVEKAFYEDFDGDKDAFVEFISHNCSANNSNYEIDPAVLERLYDEGDASGDSGKTVEEVFEELLAKYDRN